MATLVILAGLSASCGCGGAGTQSRMGQPPHDATGTVSLNVAWPATAPNVGRHVIPAASNSILIDIANSAGRSIAHKLIARPTTTASLVGIEPGQCRLTATAYPSTDGSGISQAKGQVTITVIADTITQHKIVMGSTVDHVAVSPASASLVVGGSTGLVTTAFDATGATVLTASSDWTWSSSNSAVASVTANGQSATLTGVAAGVATVNAVEKDSGKMASIPVKITSGTSPKYAVRLLTGTGGFTDLTPMAINSSGNIAGIMSNASAVSHAFVIMGGVVTDIGSLAGDDSAAAGINDNNVVAGTGNRQAFVYNAGKLTWIPFLPSETSAEALAISNGGVVVGFSDVGPFSYSNGVFTPLNYDGSATAVNTVGTAVGYANVNQVASAVIFSDGSVQGINPPGAWSSSAAGINDAGIVVGVAFMSGAQNPAAFIYSNGSFDILPEGTNAYGINSIGVAVGDWVKGTQAHAVAFTSSSSITDLNDAIPAGSGWTLEQAYAINKNGQIVGTGHLNGQPAAFELTPQ